MNTIENNNDNDNDNDDEERFSISNKYKEKENNLIKQNKEDNEIKSDRISEMQEFN